MRHSRCAASITLLARLESYAKRETSPPDIFYEAHRAVWARDLTETMSSTSKELKKLSTAKENRSRSRNYNTSLAISTNSITFRPTERGAPNYELVAQRARGNRSPALAGARCGMPPAGTVAAHADDYHTETNGHSVQEAPGGSTADPTRAAAAASGESSIAASSELVELCAGGIAGGHAAYDLVRRAASDPAAEFWERWASRELHWHHATLGAWLSQSADGGWTGWTMDGSPTTLDSWQPWEAAVDASEAPHVRWFCGAQTNAAFNEVDRQVLRGYGGEVAFVAESPSGETTHITRRWLLLHSVLIAHAVRDGLRVTAPQRIALYRRRVRRRPFQRQ